MKPPTSHAPDPPGLRHPGRWLWLVLLLPVVIGLSRLHFDAEVFDLLPSTLPAVQGLKLYQEHFANAQELIITIQADSAEEAEANARSIAERLRHATDLVESVTWEPPWMEHPDQAAELIGYLWLNQPPEVFADLTNRLAPGSLAATLASTKDELATSMSPQEIGRLSYDPYGLTRLPEGASGSAPAFGQGQELFSSADGAFRMIFVKARGQLGTYRDCDHWLRAIRKLASIQSTQVAKPGFVKIGFTGRPAFVAEIATGMERDMTKSVGGTAVIIAALFWLAHRRVKPMLWLLALLTVILGCTLALGGLIFGAINVVSMGFAAILLGLAVDYAVVHYQEALAQPTLTIPQIRHAIAPSIFWAAVTTISAFLVLNFGGLPGLGQLGTLVGLGVGLAALIMIFEFLPPLFPGRNEQNLGAENPMVAPYSQGSSLLRRLATLPPARVFICSIALLIATAAILSSGLPAIDSTATALRPKQSAAYEAVEQIQALLSQKRDPLWLIVAGQNTTEVAAKLDRAESVLTRAVSNGWIAGFKLATPIWPREVYQEANRATARFLGSYGPGLREAALTNGFTEQSLVLTEKILNTWRLASQHQGVFWPTNPMSEWIFAKTAARTGTSMYTLGMVTPSIADTQTRLTGHLAAIRSELPAQGVWLSGWELLGGSIFQRVRTSMWRVIVPMVFLVGLSLFLAFRRLNEIMLSITVLLLSGLCLLGVMRVAGWSWNLLNLMALPLVLGTGVDYSIFMQLALRRHHGDLGAAYASVGRALLLCGGTAIAGFGSLAWSNNAGMASLGQVCAVGIGSNMLIAIFLLPTWWDWLSKPRPAGASTGKDKSAPPTAPSSLYCSYFWRLGLGLVKILPLAFITRLAQSFASLYWLLAGHRRAVVVRNLGPALGNDQARSRMVTKTLFQHFARKVVALWRYEAGLPIEPMLGSATGWEYFEEAQAQKRGILVLTPHLGNWEFGGPMLTRRGVSLQVLTLAEPGRDFTQLRQASRARWQIETLVVGEDPLAFVEIIKRLEAGATVALLIDRPPAPSAVTVELFGRPFAASIAAAELARASGCVLLPVYMPWEAGGYAAHMLPPIPYERAALRDRAARQRLTQEIVHLFEPIIHQYLDQWYHFVPVWPPERESAQPLVHTQPSAV